MDPRKAAIYLAVTMNLETQGREGIRHLMPVRKHRKGVRPGEFTQELTQKAGAFKKTDVVDSGDAWFQHDDQGSKWRLPRDSFSREQSKSII